jgi:1-acyl-sn-glycerol-3-phosphate acyltransferase
MVGERSSIIYIHAQGFIISKKITLVKEMQQVQPSVKSELPRDAHRQARVTYFVQTMAHLCFMGSGFCFLFKWFIKKLLGFSICRKKERDFLAKGFRIYLNFLQKNGIIELQFEGFEDVQDWKGCVIAPNHPTILDAIILMAFVPALDCVVNAKLVRNPITSGAVKLCDFVRNDSPLNISKECKERIAAGANILIFPEGTRTIHKPLDVFFPIYALIAKTSRAPIRTIFITCDSDYFGRKFSYFQPAACPMRFRVSAGRIFEPDSAWNPRSLSREVEDYFRAELGAPPISSESC